MKSNETKNINRTDKDARESRQRDAAAPQEAVKTHALSALHGLRSGEWPASLSPEKREEAAGLLGNQNVLSLMETGAEIHRTLMDAGKEADTQGLAAALSGPPDGPVCAMENFIAP